MAYHARTFIDFWNLSINWNDRMPEGTGIDWRKLPKELMAAAATIYSDLGIEADLELDETLVYASVDLTAQGKKLRGWLETFLDRLPSVRVTTKERRPRPYKVHCRHCDTEILACPTCSTTLTRAVEKGVDTHIITDLLTLGFQNKFDVAILVSSDADFVPGVTRIQEQGLKVINATWAGTGHELRKACWASVELDSIAPNMTRPIPTPVIP